jgi:hypothetical protein
VNQNEWESNSNSWFAFASKLCKAQLILKVPVASGATAAVTKQQAVGKAFQLLGVSEAIDDGESGGGDSEDDDLECGEGENGDGDGENGGDKENTSIKSNSGAFKRSFGGDEDVTERRVRVKTEYCGGMAPACSLSSSSSSGAGGSIAGSSATTGSSPGVARELGDVVKAAFQLETMLDCNHGFLVSVGLPGGCCSATNPWMDSKNNLGFTLNFDPGMFTGKVPYFK